MAQPQLVQVVVLACLWTGTSCYGQTSLGYSVIYTGATKPGNVVISVHPNFTSTLHMLVECLLHAGHMLGLKRVERENVLLFVPYYLTHSGAQKYLRESEKDKMVSMF